MCSGRLLLADSFSVIAFNISVETIKVSVLVMRKPTALIVEAMWMGSLFSRVMEKRTLASVSRVKLSFTVIIEVDWLRLRS